LTPLAGAFNAPDLAAPVAERAGDAAWCRAAGKVGRRDPRLPVRRADRDHRAVQREARVGQRQHPAVPRDGERRAADPPVQMRRRQPRAARHRLAVDRHQRRAARAQIDRRAVEIE
jgi:hypothetical protein